MIRNVWSNAVIFCGHFPDGAEKFTKTDMVGETSGQWYLRQMLGSANFDAGPALAVHERQPVLPDRAPPLPRSAEQPAAEIAVRVRAVCDKYDLPYTTGSFLLQYGKTWRTIAKLSLPDNYLRDTADDAPETRSERMFTELGPGLAGATPGRGRQTGIEDRDRNGAAMAPRPTRRTADGSGCNSGASSPCWHTSRRRLHVRHVCAQGPP